MSTGTELSTGRRVPSDLVAEYDEKRGKIDDAITAFGVAQTAIKMACSIGGTTAHDRLEVGRISKLDAERFLLKSAWRHFYSEYGLADILPAGDKRRIEQLLENPAAFTLDNIREEFGAYIVDPWGAVLRGLAEAFCSLDPAFKSHEKVKIGVKGLPKRVILGNVSGYGSWGRDRLRDILNAIAAYQGKPLVVNYEIAAILEDGEALRDGLTYTPHFKSDPVVAPPRGVWLKRFQNGNGHLYFTPETLGDVNRALSEYYGDVLPDAPSANAKRQASTAVSKDLQYFPTPIAVVSRAIANLGNISGKRVLEPSCGCGRFMDELRKNGADVFGIEFDAGRVAEVKGKGHNVLRANFLETVPTADYDFVAMNPPFYGRHYAKHIRHAMKFLRTGGKLVSVLPITARYDHGELDDLNARWDDLPVGSFSESGTNINTTIATIIRK